MEIKNKFYIESIPFATFKTLNAQVLRETFLNFQGHMLEFPKFKRVRDAFLKYS